MSWYLDLASQVIGVLARRHGGTGNRHGWGTGLLKRALNRTGESLAIGTLVRLHHPTHSGTEIRKADVEDGPILGVVIGRYAADGVTLLEQAVPSGAQAAVMTHGTCRVLIATAVTKGQLAYVSGTPGQAKGSGAGFSGSPFGTFEESAASGLARVTLYGSQPGRPPAFFVGTNSGPNSSHTECDLPAFLPGDLAIVIAGNALSTAPGLPTGWTSLRADDVAGASTRLGYRFLEAADLTTGVWSSAQRVMVMVYRGATPGAVAFARDVAGTGDVITVPALGTVEGVVAGFAYKPGQDVSSHAPAGMVNRTAGNEYVGMLGADTGGIVASWAGGATPATGHSSWRAYALELLGGSTDPLHGHSHANLGGVGVNDHHDRDHAGRHAPGGGDPIAVAAEDVAFDGTASGLAAADVQAAIDEHLGDHPSAELVWVHLTTVIDGEPVHVWDEQGNAVFTQATP